MGIILKVDFLGYLNTLLDNLVDNLELREALVHEFAPKEGSQKGLLEIL